jgi:hypothetical protein
MEASRETLRIPVSECVIDVDGYTQNCYTQKLSTTRRRRLFAFSQQDCMRSKLPFNSSYHHCSNCDRYVEEYLTRSQIRFPIRKFPELKHLAEAVLREFSPKNLSLDTRLGTGAVVRPVESCYQDEFYRCLCDVLGFTSRVRSEWSGDHDGRIDFRITDVDWGIEILRDGDRLDAHCRRFVNNGNYTGWIRKGWLKDWLIIDCRTSKPRPYSEYTPT